MNDRQLPEDIYRLTPLQEGILYHALYADDPSVYVDQVRLRLGGHLDSTALAQAFRGVIARHTALRTSFHWQDIDHPVQVVHRHVELPWSEVDLRDCPEHERERRFEDLASAARRTGAPLDAAPLFRFLLVRLDHAAWGFVWTVHHIVADGWSLSRVLSEALSLYDAARRGRPAALPPAMPFRRYVAWLRKRDAGQADAFWRRELAALSSPTPLATFAEPPDPDRDRDALCAATLELPSALALGLQALARERRWTLATLLQAVWAIVLARTSDQTDVLFGVTSAGRRADMPGVDDAVGLFISTLPVRVRVPDDITVASWLDELGLRLSAVREREGDSLSRIQASSDLPPGAPLFESLVVVENYPLDSRLLGGDISGLEVQGAHVVEHRPYPLTLVASLRGGGVHLELRYDPARFATRAAEQWLAHLERVLRLIQRDPLRRLGRVDLCGSEDARFTSSQPSSQPLPPARREGSMGMAGRFAAHAASAPDAIALVDGARRVTYGDLAARVYRLARELRRRGVGPEVRVGLCLGRSAELVWALLGIVVAGGAYVPLDPDYPRERLEYLARDARLSLVVTQREHGAKLGDAPVLCVDDPEIAASIDAQDPSPCLRPVDGHQLFYVIYTSGSTGRPKGVEVEHGNVERLFDATDAWFGFGRDDVFTLFHSISFDFSVWELWGALARGGRLVVVPYGISRSPDAFVALVRAEGVTVLNQTPSAFRGFAAAEAEGDPRALRLRLVIFGGEALDFASLRPWFERHGDARPELVNMYGITETTVHVTYRPLRAEDARASASRIGRPIPDLQLDVLDSGGRPVPTGVAGELHVSGPGVARGYLGRPALTAERFAPSPRGGRAYKTGDRVRRLSDGDIEYLGRGDHQIKLRGHRIELGEIEAVLLAQPHVREAIVLVREDVPSDRRLVAYVCLRARGDDTEDPRALLRLHAEQHLPAYMVPAAIVVLDALPLTQHGKLDRAALPPPGEGAWRAEVQGAAPRTLVEEALCAIWAQVLGRGKVGIDESFFELGGDSLLSVQVRARARQRGLDFTLQDLMRSQTIRELSRHVSAAKASPVPSTRPFELCPPEVRATLPGDVVDAFPLAQLQSGMIFHSERDGAYQNAARLGIGLRFEPAAFAAAAADVTARHPALRTSFDLTRPEEPLQLVHARADLPVEVRDLRDLSDEEQERAVTERLSELRSRPFDLQRPPLLRLVAFVRGDERFDLVIVEHHAILDGWSLAVFVDDLLRALQHRLAHGDRPCPLGADAEGATMRDFVARERAAIASQESERYFREALAGLDAAALPRWPLDPADRGEGVRRVAVPIAPEISDKLRSVARSAGVPLKSVLLAVHAAVLAFVAGKERVVTGVSMHGRAEVDGADRSLGLFIQLAPLAIDAARGSFLELAGACFRGELELLSHARVPVAHLQQRLGERLFEVGFNFTHFHVAAAALRGAVSSVDGAAPTSLPLMAQFHVDPRDERVGLDLDCDTCVLARADIETIAGVYGRALSCFVERPEAPIADAPLLGADELSRIERWERNAAPYPADGTVHELFALQAARTPEANAVVFADRRLTYRELDAAANALARVLVSRGVGRGAAVGLCMERSAEAIVGMLATLKAGAYYVPLDPAYPLARLRFIASDTRMHAILARGPHVEVAGALGPEVIALDAGSEALTRAAASAPGALVGPDELAYVVYTSGSTGEPKGVAIPHRAILRLACGTDYVSLGPGDVVAHAATLNFDAATFEIWAPLLAGASVAGVPRDTALTPSELATHIRASGITTLFLTTALFNKYASECPGAFSSLSSLLFGGERVDPRRVADVLRDGRPRRLVHVYGPTETTTFATYQCVDAVAEGAASVPIGGPIANTEAFVLDCLLRRVPPGTPGELYIGGPGLARGYLGKPAATADAFVPHPFAREPGSRLYRTGDRVRRGPDGAIEFLGRLDDQVKLRGFRIELGEIDAALRRVPGVEAAAAVIREDDAGRRIVAYFVPGPGDALSVTSVTSVEEALRRALPAFMIPSDIVALPALPMNTNGKVDRRALPPPPRRAAPERLVAPAQDSQQALLVQIWASLFGVDRVGVDDSFFELGGDSLLSLQMVHRAHAQGFTFSLADLYASPTIRALADRVGPPSAIPARAPFAVLGTAARSALPGDVEDAYPLTQLQLAMLLHSEHGAYINVTTLRLRRSVAPEHLREALALLTARHPVLRSSFALDEGIQRVHAAVEVPISLGEDAARFARDARSDLARREAWTVAPLLRVALCSAEGQEPELVLAYHHAQLDGWSVATLLAELMQILRREALPPPPLVGMPELARRERDALDRQEDRGFWAGVLADAPSAALPLPRRSDGASGVHRRLLQVVHAQRLRQAAVRLGVPLKSVLFAVHLRALALFTGRRRVCTGLTVSTRPEGPSADRAIGIFMNTLPLSVELPSGSWARLVRAAFEVERDAMAHRFLPLSAILRESPHVAPLESAFNFSHFRAIGAGAPDIGSATADGETHFALGADFNLDPRNDDLTLTLHLDLQRFTPAHCEELTRWYLEALEALAQDPEAPHAALWATRSTPGSIAAGSCPERPRELLHHAFERMARVAPTRAALVAAGAPLDYATLDGRANALAHRLQELGARPDVIVGVWSQRTPDLIVAIYAIMKAGAAFLVLDPTLPVTRLAAQRADSGVKHILADGTPPPELLDEATRVLAVGPDVADLPPPCDADPDNIAFVVYTSGSSGAPKGVAVSHASALNHRLWRQEVVPLLPDDCQLQLIPPAFDPFVAECFGPLAVGARLVMPTWSGQPPLRELSRLLVEQQVTRIQVSPPLLRLLADEGVLAEATALKQIFCGGEALTASLVERCASQTRALLTNFYGPTETCIEASGYTCASLSPGETVPIGSPVARARLYILGDELGATPVGVPGELFIAGAGLARGYLGRPGLTAERFLPDPHSPVPGGRMYRSGDLATMRPDGAIEFMGRMDRQLKIRGVRVEPGEIEAALLARAEVAEAAVVADDLAGLRAFVVLRPGAAIEPEALRERVASGLPAPMVPRQVHCIQEMPLTPTGKIDRRALVESTRGVPEATPFVAARDDAEARLASIVADVLGARGPLGVETPWHQLGGDSLTALRLAARLEQRFGRRVPLATILADGRISKIAQALSSATALAGERSVLLRAGPGSPLFCVHAAGGGALIYRDIAQKLRSGRRVVGLPAPGLDGERAPFSSLVDLAAHHADTIAGLVPEGPCDVLGWSLGGAVAFETARQLLRKGREVGLVVVIDTHPDELRAAPADLARVDYAALFLAELGLSRNAPLGALEGELGRGEPYEVARALGLVPADLPRAVFARLLAIFEANLRAGWTYRFEPIPCRVLLLLAESPGQARAERAFRELVRGRMEVVRLPFDHYGILRGGGVDAAVAALDAALDAAP
ncbi:amino acid adenylation domain-containing protein [Sorangium sp. So ce375]|uniref:non-ribosomal peptide synthetase n=1 Tax=Sorangium sp. So ce375 TaxID=3133306 RepID=UPI003F5CAFB4